jgi:hypothetical protein
MALNCPVVDAIIPGEIELGSKDNSSSVPPLNRIRCVSPARLWVPKGGKSGIADMLIVVPTKERPCCTFGVMVPPGERSGQEVIMLGDFGGASRRPSSARW